MLIWRAISRMPARSDSVSVAPIWGAMAAAASSASALRLKLLMASLKSRLFWRPAISQNAAARRRLSAQLRAGAPKKRHHAPRARREIARRQCRRWVGKRGAIGIGKALLLTRGRFVETAKRVGVGTVG